MFRTENLSKAFQRSKGKPVQALDGVSLDIPKGSFFGLLGPNGAGKSTLISCLTGYLKPDLGEIFLDGEIFNCNDRQMRRKIGFVPQEIALYDSLSALENLCLFGRIFGLEGKAAKTRALAVLDQVGLSARGRDHVKTFSGGMKRRVNLGVALLHEPEILLCDEPTVGVDPQSRNALFEILENLHADGLTLLYTTHYMEEVERLCERIAIVDQGRILAAGNLSDLLENLPFAAEIRLSELPASTRFCEELRREYEVQREGPVHVLRPARGAPLAPLLGRIEAAGIPPTHFSMRRPSLEHLFLHLTGRTLRD
jgi:ABC-2 type transport system ATP-binding protein